MTFEDGNFNNFAQANPQIAEQLMHNPGLADNPAYLASHPQLGNFIRKYPKAGAALQSNPSAFLRQDAVRTHGSNPGPVSNPGEYGMYGHGGYGGHPYPYGPNNDPSWNNQQYHHHHDQGWGD